MIGRGSSFLRQVGGGKLNRRQNALVRFHASSTTVAQTAVDTLVSKDDSSTRTNLLPYFSIYYNGKSNSNDEGQFKSCSLFTNKPHVCLTSIRCLGSGYATWS